MELIDTHCHLNYDYAPKSEQDVVREAEQAGVRFFVTIGVDMKTLPDTIAVSERYPNVFHTVGVHPHEAIDFRDEDIETLKKLASHPKCRGIGEIGLDYHYDHSPREVQRKVLDQQLQLALEVGQPVIIHSREAEEDLLSALSLYAGQVPNGKPVGVIHCFSGSRAFGEACLKLGFHISFSGIVTFKKALEIQDCARDFPLDRIVVETDSPYLAPIPHRGKKCEPGMVKLTAMKIAELRNLPLEEIARATTANARSLFRIQ
jgi:TatD DNase family protein